MKTFIMVFLPVEIYLSDKIYEENVDMSLITKTISQRAEK